MKINFLQEITEKATIKPEYIVKLLLKNRKIKNVKDFLHPKNPFNISLNNFGSYQARIKKSLKILTELHKNQQMIVVYTDYDADGITGGAILWETLHLLGFKVMPYVPDRKQEGYGFSLKGIDNVIKKFNPALIISVDHRITKVEEVAYTKKKKIKVIITDHHLKQETIPKADAVFHLPELSGAGVAYFFAKEIYQYLRGGVAPAAHLGGEAIDWQKLNNNFQNDYLALASIGIIADLVPLVGPARSLTKYGLEAFVKTKRIGLIHILRQAGIEGRKITPYEVGFIIAPRINAVGRLENAIDALRLLCTKREDRAYHLAHHVGAKNIERQLMVEKSVQEAKKTVGGRTAAVSSSAQATEDREERDGLARRSLDEGGKTESVKLKDKIIILVSDKWHEGIIGLIASKIADEFYRPTIVMTKVDGSYKGSARSIPGFHITNFLRSLKKYLVDVGGHQQAAGFTIEKEKLNDFCTIVQRTSSKLIKNKDLERKIEADLKIPIGKISLSLVKTLEQLQPFGIGNPRPTFYSQAQIVDANTFGKKNDHLKIWVKDINHPRGGVAPAAHPGGEALELISFSSAQKLPDLPRGKIIDVVYSLEIDRWGGERLRGRMVSFI